MRAHRFGNKIKLSTSLAIKHQLLTMMFEDEVRAIPPGGHFKENESPALARLRRLRGSPSRAVGDCPGPTGCWGPLARLAGIRNHGLYGNLPSAGRTRQRAP